MTLTPMQILRLTLIGGLAGEIAFEAFAFGLGPILTGRVMEPAYLVIALARLLGAEIGYVGGWIGHLMAGLILFPLGYLAYLRLTPPQPWAMAGLIWGLILWAVAQGVLAPLVGRGFMMGFVSYTWASLAAHMLYGLVVAGAMRRAMPGLTRA